MGRVGSTQIRDHVHSTIGDIANEVPSKLPARRGLAGLNVNATRRVEKKSNNHSAKSQFNTKKMGHGSNVFTKSRIAPVAVRLNQSSRKQKAVFVYEDSPEKAKAEEHDSESDGEEEKEEEMGGVDQYFKSKYNVAENADVDEMWNNLEVETCGDPPNQSNELAMYLDGVYKSIPADVPVLEHSPEFLEVMRRREAEEDKEEEEEERRRMRAEEDEEEEEGYSSGVDENNQSI